MDALSKTQNDLSGIFGSEPRRDSSSGKFVSRDTPPDPFDAMWEEMIAEDLAKPRKKPEGY